MIASSGDRRWLWLVLATGIALGDQGAKAWIAGWLPYGAGQPVMPFFSFVHVLNEGAAFSLLAGAGGWQRYFFITLALIVSAALVVLLLRGVGSRREAAGYSLVLGGAMGTFSNGVAVRPDGQRVFISNGKDATVSVIDTATNSVIATVPVGNRPWNMALTPDGKKLYVANGKSNSVSVIDTETNQKLRDIAVGESPWGVVIR